MGYLIKSSVIDAIEEDMQDTMMCYEGQREKDIIAFCYESMKRVTENLPQYRVDNVVEDTGLTSDEISRLKERDTEKSVIITGYNRAVGCKVGECPKCGTMSRDYMNFCNECGQRLKWKEES